MTNTQVINRACEINSYKNRFKKAFSLIELMFALVAISIAFAAFAPAITNKYAQENEMVHNKGQLITSECDYDKYKTASDWVECTLCYGEESCVTCGGECPPGKIKNKSKCTCE